MDMTLMIFDAGLHITLMYRQVCEIITYNGIFPYLSQNLLYALVSFIWGVPDFQCPCYLFEGVPVCGQKY